MPGAGGVRAGKAFVEIFADDSALRRGLKRAEARLRAFGKGLRAVGKEFAKVGTGALLGLGAATKVFSTYEDGLAKLRAAAKPSAEELVQIKAAIADIGKRTGAGPADVANAMTELLKAGLPLEKVLGGATEAAIQFAKVGELEVAEAAVVITDAMNIFGTDATTAIDTLSSAADSSSVSIRQIVESFSEVGSTAKLAGLSIRETSTLIAILGNNGIKGAEAGTALKTMFLRLLAPAEEGAKAIEDLGINTRNADGSMRGVRDILGELREKIGGLNDEARDSALRDIFGDRAIRSAAVFLKEGVAGFDKMAESMGKNLSVADKFAILMDTLSGFAQRAWAAIQRLAIAIGAALGPALGDLGRLVSGAADGLARLVEENGPLIVRFAQGAAAVAGLGAALYAAGTAAGLLGAAIDFLASPLGIATAAIAAFLTQTEMGREIVAGLAADFTLAFEGIAAALSSGDLEGAIAILWATLKVEWIKGTTFLEDVWGRMTDALASLMIDAWAGIRTIWTAGLQGIVALLKPLADAIEFVTGVDVGKQLDAAAAALGAGGDIEGDRQAQQKALVDAREAAAEEGRKAVAEAQADLQSELDAQKVKALAPAFGEGATGGGGPGGVSEAKKKGLDEAVRRAGGKAEAKGGFAADVRALGIGDSIEKDQLDELKKIRSGVDGVRSAVEDSGATVGP